MDNTLGDFLNDEPQPETEAEPIAADENLTGEAVIDESSDERPRDEHGRFISKEPTGVETPTAEAAEPVPPTEPTDRLPQAEYAALRDERQKRQNLEARLQELETYLQAQQQQQPPATPPDMFEDPDGFAAHLQDKILRSLQPSLQGAGTVTHAKLCERLARQEHQDYDATVEVFKEELAKNPYLLTELQQADDPAIYAYNVGKHVQQARAYGSAAPPSREQIEAEIREKILAEVGLNRPKAPSTFAGDRSVGSRSGPAWTGPTPLRDMLS